MSHDFIHFPNIGFSSVLLQLQTTVETKLIYFSLYTIFAIEFIGYKYY